MKKLIPVIVFCIALAVIICIPLKVISYGFLPVDDALRHSAKVISEKNWSQILILREGFSIDSHPGWHFILGTVRQLASCNQDALVTFSITALFLLFCLMPVFFLDRPEAWLLSLLAIVVTAPYMMIRLFFGRPYILTMSIMLAVFFMWPLLKEKKKNLAAMAALTALVALSAWIHGSWYLFALPAAAFFISRETRAGIRFVMCAAIGVLIGASLTGHPVLFLKQTFIHMTLALGSSPAQRLLVSEFRPSTGDALIVLFALGMLIWRKLRGERHARTVYNPVFVLAVLGWMLGFVSSRFWTDWGLPALAFWMAAEFSDYLGRSVDYASWKRLFLTLAVSVALFLGITADSNSRWTYNLTTEYLVQGDPKRAAWLPEPGGIIYSDDMGVFYQTFFKNPKAPWRYILGFEPAMMPAEDLAILRKIQWNFGTPEAFKPWVAKMRAQDRLIIKRGHSAKPNIPELEWYYAATDTWIGRLPRR